MKPIQPQDSSVSQSHLPRPDSSYSLSESEIPSSCHDSTPNQSPSPTQSVCSEIPNLDSCLNLSRSNREISFDLISSVCESVGGFLAAQIDRVRMSPSPSPFDALSEPKISLPAYFERIRHYSQATPETILCAVVLIRRISKFTGLPLTNLNSHRLLVSAVMVFAKFYDDEIDSNARWARIAGVKKVEINNLEVEFLNRCQFDLRVSPEDFHDIVYQIASFHSSPRVSAETQEGEAEATPSTPSKGHLWSFHVKHGKKLRPTKSMHYGGETADNRTHAKSIMSFFHHTNHAHLNPFPRSNCSPMSMNLASPGAITPSQATPNSSSKGFESAPESPGISPTNSVCEMENTPTRRSQRSLPRGPSLQHIAAMLHNASPFIQRPQHKDHRKEHRSMVVSHGF